MRLIPARDFISGREAVCPQAARALFEEAHAALLEGDKPMVSFYGVQHTSLGFLFKAVAQLYLVHEEAEASKVQVLGLTREQLLTLETLIDEAKAMRLEATKIA